MVTTTMSMAVTASMMTNRLLSGGSATEPKAKTISCGNLCRIFLLTLSNRCKNCNGKFQHTIQHRKSWWLLCNNQVQYKSASHTSHTTFSKSLKRVCALKVPEISKDHFSTTTSAAFSRVEGDWVNFNVSVGWTLSFHVKGSRKMWPSYLLLL